MKAYQTLKYLAFAGAISLWGCSKQQYAQNSEYDDLYFSSQDKKEVVYTASTASKDYSSVENKGIASEDYSQKNVNPEYVQEYADQSRSNANADTNGDDSYSAEDTYYDENYSRNNVNLARNYNRRNAGNTINIFPSYGFGNFYGGSAFYDPFYDPFLYGRGYYDPFFARPFYSMRPGLSIGFGMGMGWGSPWGWNDPFYYGGRWGNPYAYNSPWGWGDPFYSGYGYGYGYGNPYRYGYGNNVIVVPGNTTDRRTVQYGPRSGRATGTVNNDFNNSPRGTRGGRAENSNPDAVTNPGGRTSGSTYTDGTNSRAVRPRSDGSTTESNSPYYNPNNAGGRIGTPAAGSESAAPRAVRPRGNDVTTPSNSNRRNYDYYNNSNRNSSPSYNNNTTSPRQQRYDNSSTPRSNNNWNNNSRSSGSDYNRSSGGSFSSPSRSSSPSPSSGSSSPRSSGSSGASPRSPR